MPNALAFLRYAPDAPMSHRIELGVRSEELGVIWSIYNDNPCSVSKGSVGWGRLSTKKVMRIVKRNNNCEITILLAASQLNSQQFLVKLYYNKTAAPWGRCSRVEGYLNF